MKDKKEIRLVQMLSLGHTVKDIADDMEINVRTLEARLVRIKDKNGATNIPHLVANFLRTKKII